MPTPMGTQNIPLRLEDEIVERLERLATVMGERAAGAKITRNAATRSAILRGLDALELELGITKPAQKTKKK